MTLQNNFPMHLGEESLEEIATLSLLDVDTQDHQIPLFKRSFDIIIALVLSLLLAPLLLFITFIIKMSDGGPAIFTQTRIGRNGEAFPCRKFRTMIVDSEIVLEKVLMTNPEAAAEWAAEQKLKDDPRITAMGNFLRKSSLDELPQLWNILRGDMSLVGPRPIVQAEIKKYGRFYRDYVSVPPGITGLWQVSGRNNIGYEERVKMDVEYVRTFSFKSDLKILFLTIPAVLFAKGAY